MIPFDQSPKPFVALLRGAPHEQHSVSPAYAAAQRSAGRAVAVILGG
jgi:hypothetical protein